jgi:hypothetical protein
MRIKHLWSLLLVSISCVAAIGGSNTARQHVTLYAPLKYNHDESRATFSFERGGRGPAGAWDLLYGNLQIGDDLDWFSASTAKDNRSLIRDLGALNWSDSYVVPVITPLPKLEEGKERNITVDSSGDTGKSWAGKNGVFVKAVEGHMYAMHVKDTDSDLYVIFRVEGIERGDNCTISWRVVPSPEE